MLHSIYNRLDAVDSDHIRIYGKEFSWWAGLKSFRKFTWSNFFSPSHLLVKFYTNTSRNKMKRDLTRVISLDVSDVYRTFKNVSCISNDVPAFALSTHSCKLFVLLTHTHMTLFKRRKRSFLLHAVFKR